MTLKEYLNGLKNKIDPFMDNNFEDYEVETLIKIIEKQSEALEFYESALNMPEELGLGEPNIDPYSYPRKLGMRAKEVTEEIQDMLEKV